MPVKPQTARAAAKRATAKKPLNPRGKDFVGANAKPTSLQKLFSDNVRRVRKARGFSQEALAGIANLDRTYVSSIERKLRNVSIRNIQRIAEALQVEPRVSLDPQLSSDRRFGASNTPAGASKRVVRAT